VHLKPIGFYSSLVCVACLEKETWSNERTYR
jgi:hypothetical protein